MTFVIQRNKFNQFRIAHKDHGYRPSDSGYPQFDDIYPSLEKASEALTNLQQRVSYSARQICQPAGRMVATQGGILR